MTSQEPKKKRGDKVASSCQINLAFLSIPDKRIDSSMFETSQSTQNAKKIKATGRTLKKGDGDRIKPRRLHFHCHQKVVTVHEGMNPKVHGHKYYTVGGRMAKAMPAV